MRRLRVYLQEQRPCYLLDEYSYGVSMRLSDRSNKFSLSITITDENPAEFRIYYLRDHKYLLNMTYSDIGITFNIYEFYCKSADSMSYDDMEPDDHIVTSDYLIDRSHRGIDYAYCRYCKYKGYFYDVQDASEFSDYMKHVNACKKKHSRIISMQQLLIVIMLCEMAQLRFTYAVERYL